MKTYLTATFLSITTLLHSCIVYQSTSIPLNEAANRGSAMVVNTRDDKLTFKNINLIDSAYYGIYGKTQTRLYPYQISAVYLKDIDKSKKKKRKTTIIVASVIVGIPVLLLGITIALIYLNPGSL
jgi:hypothetical protein